MALVPQELLSTIQAKQQEEMTPLVKSALSVDGQMQEVMSRQDLGDDEKATLYQQLLQRYLTYRDKRRAEPVSVRLVTSNSTPSATVTATNNVAKDEGSTTTSPSTASATGKEDKAILAAFPLAQIFSDEFAREVCPTEACPEATTSVMSDNSQQPAASTELTSAGPNTVPTPVHRMTYPDITMTNLDMAQLTDDDDRSLVNFLLGELGETHEAYLDFLAASLDEETIQSLDDVMASDLASLGAGNTDALVDSSGCPSLPPKTWSILTRNNQAVQDQPMSDSPPEFAMDAETQTAGPESTMDVGTQTAGPETPLDLRLKRPADANWTCAGAPPAKRHKGPHLVCATALRHITETDVSKPKIQIQKPVTQKATAARKDPFVLQIKKGNVTRSWSEDNASEPFSSSPRNRRHNKLTQEEELQKLLELKNNTAGATAALSAQGVTAGKYGLPSGFFSWQGDVRAANMAFSFADQFLESIGISTDEFLTQPDPFEGETMHLEPVESSTFNLTYSSSSAFHPSSFCPNLTHSKLQFISSLKFFPGPAPFPSQIHLRLQWISSGYLNFLDRHDVRFAEFHKALDARMKELAADGVGASTRQADPLTPDDEDKLWTSSTISTYTATGKERRTLCLQFRSDVRSPVGLLTRQGPPSFVVSESSSDIDDGGDDPVCEQSRPEDVPVGSAAQPGEPAEVAAQADGKDLAPVAQQNSGPVPQPDVPLLADVSLPDAGPVPQPDAPLPADEPHKDEAPVAVDEGTTDEQTDSAHDATGDGGDGDHSDYEEGPSSQPRRNSRTSHPPERYGVYVNNVQLSGQYTDPDKTLSTYSKTTNALSDSAKVAGKRSARVGNLPDMPGKSDSLGATSSHAPTSDKVTGSHAPTSNPARSYTDKQETKGLSRKTNNPTCEQTRDCSDHTSENTGKLSLEGGHLQLEKESSGRTEMNSLPATAKSHAGTDQEAAAIHPQLAADTSCRKARFFVLHEALVHTKRQSRPIQSWSLNNPGASTSSHANTSDKVTGSKDRTNQEAAAIHPQLAADTSCRKATEIFMRPWFTLKKQRKATPLSVMVILKPKKNTVCKVVLTASDFSISPDNLLRLMDTISEGKQQTVLLDLAIAAASKVTTWSRQ
ncbi:hypothetical protein Bbelb_344080 [Branchiostoma belcheri]|nr:hypothetical protein Bbelb_344080 [Branchiostoma belcheri]